MSPVASKQDDYVSVWDHGSVNFYIFVSLCFRLKYFQIVNFFFADYQGRPSTRSSNRRGEGAVRGQPMVRIPVENLVGLELMEESSSPVGEPSDPQTTVRFEFEFDSHSAIFNHSITYFRDSTPTTPASVSSEDNDEEPEEEKEVQIYLKLFIQINYLSISV